MCSAPWALAEGSSGRFGVSSQLFHALGLDDMFGHQENPSVESEPDGAGEDEAEGQQNREHWISLRIQAPQLDIPNTITEESNDPECENHEENSKVLTVSPVVLHELSPLIVLNNNNDEILNRKVANQVKFEKHAIYNT